MIVPVKSYANIVNLGNIEHIIEIEMQDTTISFDKRKSHNIRQILRRDSFFSRERTV